MSSESPCGTCDAGGARTTMSNAGRPECLPILACRRRRRRTLCRSTETLRTSLRNLRRTPPTLSTPPESPAQAGHQPCVATRKRVVAIRLPAPSSSPHPRYHGFRLLLNGGPGLWAWHWRRLPRGLRLHPLVRAVDPRYRAVVAASPAGAAPRLHPLRLISPGPPLLPPRPIESGKLFVLLFYNSPANQSLVPRSSAVTLFRAWVIPPWFWHSPNPTFILPLIVSTKKCHSVRVDSAPFDFLKVIRYTLTEHVAEPLCRPRWPAAGPGHTLGREP